MKFLKIFKNKPLTRIEAKAHSKSSKFRVRASRTGGINASVHPLQGLTANTKHGLRASKTFKGLTLGFQRDNSVVRGRWSFKNGLLNLNLSKSGFSISSKSKYGSYNISNPSRSSFKFGGIQIRGNKAAGPALIFTLIALIPVLVKFFFNVLVYLFEITGFLLKLIINILIIQSKVLFIIYDLLMMLAIDLPKRLANHLLRKKNFKD